jgi:hypothetical protein
MVRDKNNFYTGDSSYADPIGYRRMASRRPAKNTRTPYLKYQSPVPKEFLNAYKY